MIKSLYQIGSMLVVFVLTFADQSKGQTVDAAAKTLLNNVSKAYEGYKSIQADFTLTVQQPQQTGNYTESGRILMETATGKFHITTNNQDLISDGKTQWTVLKDAQEVQVTTADHSSDAITPANIFSFYNSGYKYISAPNERAGSFQLAVVELSPEDTQTPYFKIRLRINKATNLIYDATIFDKGGVKYLYTIKNTKTNPKTSPGQFTFKPSNYPGMEIVDLR